MSVLHPGWLRLFSAAEVGTLLAGDDVEIDIDDLRKHTLYHGGYHELSPTIRALWQVLREFSNEERKAFLKFVTSCSQPPLLGFRHLEPRFAIQCVAPGSGADHSPLSGMLALVGLTPAERQRLPTAATCFNLLKLPDFRSKKLLREKLLVAIHSNSGFELS
jgi:ubiquitin-protein ligase E3 B